MTGRVADVPSLSAPGFIKAIAEGHFPDVSSFINGDLILHVQSRTADYAGFRVTFSAKDDDSSDYACSFGSDSQFPYSGGCFKAHFSVPPGDEFTEVRVPFNMFSDHWNPRTGEQTKTCADHQEVCPTTEQLGSLKRIELWAEGVNGDIQLEVKAISAGAEKLMPEAAEDESELKMVTFDGAADTTFDFYEKNDPVMVR